MYSPVWGVPEAGDEIDVEKKSERGDEENHEKLEVEMVELDEEIEDAVGEGTIST